MVVKKENIENSNSNNSKIYIKKDICPYCNKKDLQIITYEYNLPYIGKTLILSHYCPNCGYKSNDLYILNSSEGKKYIFNYESEKDLYTKIVRSQTGYIKIPELGLELIPSRKAEVFITNIEGLLNRFKRALNIAKQDALKNNDNNTVKYIENLEKKIDRIIEGKEKVTIILEDPEGNSAILSDKVKIEKLKKDDVPLK